jgi:hypothetical protein
MASPAVPAGAETGVDARAAWSSTRRQIVVVAHRARQVAVRAEAVREDRSAKVHRSSLHHRI